MLSLRNGDLASDHLHELLIRALGRFLLLLLDTVDSTRLLIETDELVEVGPAHRLVHDINLIHQVVHILLDGEF